MSAPTQVASARTPWDVVELLQSLERALVALVGVEVPPEGLATLGAQATLETGRGGSGCWNNNPSNIMGASPEGLYHTLRSAPECAPRERVPAGATILTSTNIACPPGSVAYLPPGGSRFRAYSSLELGCEDKVATLLSLWPKAVAAIVAGSKHQDPDERANETARAFVEALRRPVADRDYFTSDKVAYATSVASIAREYMARAESIAARRTLPAPPTVPTTLEANKPTESVVLEDFLGTLADDTPKV